MKNFLLSFFCLILVAANMQAQEVVFDFKSNTWGFPEGKISGENNYNNGTYSISIKSPNNESYFAKGGYLILSKTDASITLPAFDFAVSKIEVVGRGGASTSVRENIFVNTTAVSTECVGATGTNVFTINEDYRTAGNIYTLKILSNHNAQITYIYVYSEQTVAAPTFVPVSGTTFEENLEVSFEEVENTVIYYTTDGTTPNTESIEYKGAFTITEATTVKAIAVKNGTASEVATAEYTKVVNGSVADALAAYDANKQIPATVTGFIVGTNGKIGANAEWANTNILIADNAEETDKANCLVVELPDTKVRTMLNLQDNPGNFQKKVILEGSLETYFSRAGLKSLKIANIGIYQTVSNAGWATLYLGFSTIIPETVNAYVIKAEGVNENYVTLSKIEGILPANTGIILENTGEHLFMGTQADTNHQTDNNLLQGSVKNEIVEGDAYFLAMQNGHAGLYLAELDKDADGNSGNTHFMNYANKAYLPVTAGSSLSTNLRFVMEGTTDIENIETEKADDTIYDLQGRRVDEMREKGIYIINGKKILKK